MQLFKNISEEKRFVSPAIIDVHQFRSPCATLISPLERSIIYAVFPLKMHRSACCPLSDTRHFYEGNQCFHRTDYREK